MKNLLVAILAFGLVPATYAATVWDNGTPDGVNGYGSDVDTTFSFGAAVARDNFTLSSTETVRSFRWWGAYLLGGTPVPDSFTITIFDDVLAEVFSGGVVATSQATGTFVSSFEIYEYVANVPDTSLDAGDYFVSIFNDTTQGSSSVNWYWVTSAQTGNAVTTTVPGGVSTVQNAELAFQIYDTEVPEPSTLLLSAAGLAGILVARRRR